MVKSVAADGDPFVAGLSRAALITFPANLWWPRRSTFPISRGETALKNGLFVIWMAVLAVGLGAGRASAQSASAEKTIWDGVYTAAQAERGQAVASQMCSGCHSAEEWTGPGFISAWAGGPISSLHARIQSTMPADNPGLLTAEQYSEIIAFMLKLNDAPVGETELPSSAEGLGAIAVTPPHRH